MLITEHIIGVLLCRPLVTLTRMNVVGYEKYLVMVPYHLFCSRCDE